MSALRKKIEIDVRKDRGSYVEEEANIGAKERLFVSSRRGG